MGGRSRSPSARSQRARRNAQAGPRRTRETTKPTVSQRAQVSETEAYASTRAGARASRGFGYQHAVGAWVCSRVAVGEIDAIDVIPEGLEDIQVTSGEPVFIQAKSRQASQGDFTVPKVLGFLRTMMETRAAQSRDPLSERLVLALERPIEGAQSTPWEQSLADLPPTDPIRIGAEGVLGTVADGKASVATLLARTAVVVLPWGQLDSETRTHLASASGLPPGAAEPLLHTLRHEVSQCTSRNASRTLAERQTLSRQSIQRLITDTAQLIDIDSLMTAVSTGRCVPVDFDAPIDDPRFFEGIDVRPGHVVAGLPAPRKSLVEFTSDALRSQHAVLLTGPSGVGKSTVMWSTAYEMRDVLWYELTRLERGDEEDVWRILLALGPKPTSPIGLVVDSVGSKDPAAWDALRDRLPVDGSVILLGSIRTEDLSTLATAASAAIVECRMDEAVARELFEGLHGQGRTTFQVWEDAYRESHGLTLEYTYMLTKGQRLSAVLSEQVRQRERQHRSIELEVLRLVSTASRWGARVPAGALMDVAPEAAPRSEALRRLVGEHLIVLDGVHYSGLHQLRASVVSSVVHEIPPPSLEATTVELVRVVDPQDLRVMVVGCLFEQPDLAAALIEALCQRCRDSDITLLTTVLRALRTADFRRDGRAWAAILDDKAVPQAYRPVTVWLALMDSDANIGEDSWKPGIGPSIREMKATPQLPLWRDQFLAVLGTDALLAAVRTAPSLAEVEEFLGSLLGASSAAELTSAIAGLPETAQLLLSVAPEKASLFMGLLGDLAPDAARDLRERLGTDTWAESVLLALNPWMVQAAGQSDEDEHLQIHAELLYGGDWFEIDPKGQAVEAARTLLNLYPECTVDVRTINAAGDPLIYGGHEPGHSQLLRRYNQHPLAISWNRERARLAMELAMHRSDAERALVVPGLIVDVDRFLSDLASAWARQSASRTSVRQFESDRQRLISTNDSLASHSVDPALTLGDDALAPAGQKVLEDDDLHTLVDGICANLPGRLLSDDGYNALAAFVGDPLLGLVPKVRQAESQYEDSTGTLSAALNSIEGTLRELYAVLADVAYGGESITVALAPASTGGRTSAIRKCAAKATDRALARLGRKLDQLASDAASAGVDVRWKVRDALVPKATSWPQVEVALLLEIQALGEWDATLAAVDALLGQEGEFTDLGFPVLVPTMQGRPLVVLSMTRGSVLYPSVETAQAWGEQLGIRIPTPTVDALQRLWVALQAISSLTLRGCLRDEPHSLDDVPSELRRQWATALEYVSSRLEGSPLEGVWATWQVETIGSVASEAGKPDLAPNEVWVTETVPHVDGIPDALLRYLELWAAVLEFDVEAAFGSGASGAA